MGATPAELQREIARDRERLDARVATLRERARDDLTIVRTRATDDVARVGRGAAARARDIDMAEGVREHPFAGLAAAAAAGAVVGALGTGSSPAKRDGRRSAKSPSTSGSVLTEIVETLSFAAGAVREQAVTLAKGELHAVASAAMGRVPEARSQAPSPDATQAPGEPEAPAIP